MATGLPDLSCKHILLSGVPRSHPMVIGSLTLRTNQGGPKSISARIPGREANGRFRPRGEKKRVGHEAANCFIETPQSGWRLGSTLHLPSALKNRKSSPELRRQSEAQ